MIFLYAIFSLGMLTLLTAGVIEKRRHDANLDSIPIRVLVNGIRGKSSITRLTNGALRGGRLRVVAKTTGTAARYIHVDGSEVPVHRKFEIANVVEQIGIVALAASEAPDALVLECMAVDPALQELNQDHLVRATIGILCNVREDHLAEMGPTLTDVGRSLSRTMPKGGICVTAESEQWHVLAQEAERRGCQLEFADPDTVTDEEMEPFSWITFKDNVAIALRVAELVGVSREDALRGMYEAPPDPGVLSVERYQLGDKHLRFANIFAANDPNSTVMNYKRLVEGAHIRPPIHVVINCRPDRVERNGQMGEIVDQLDAELVYTIGAPTRSASSTIPNSWKGRVIDLGGLDRSGDEILREILTNVDGEASLVAVGNIHGQGEALLHELEELGAHQ